MIVLFVFGYTFYKLANTYDKAPWIWALVGAGSYIALQFLVGFGVGAFYAMNILPEMSEVVLNIVAVVTSSAIVYLGYRYLKNKWESEDTRFDAHNIDNIGKPQE